ncbi:MAG TPA: hypothetical protein VKE74_03295 [Gemmataceae bacterium]|nr:hypothetical protein [Gemmataceae bacterium]
MDTPKPAAVDAARQVQAMLDRGWLWSQSEPDVLVHPRDFGLSVRYDRAAGTLSMSPALARYLDLVIPTPAGQSKVFRK